MPNDETRVAALIGLYQSDRADSMTTANGAMAAIAGGIAYVGLTNAGWNSRSRHRGFHATSFLAAPTLGDSHLLFANHWRFNGEVKFDPPTGGRTCERG